MNKRRDLKIPERIENVREKRKALPIIKFKLDEILSHFETNMDAVRKQLITAEELATGNKTDEAQYIWRSQIVFCVSALDFYMHELVKYGLSQIFDRRWERTTGYNKLKVCMEHVEIIRNSPEAEWFSTFINSLYSSSALGSYKSIKEQLKIIGIDINEVEHIAFTSIKGQNEQKGCLENKLDTLWGRRNQIAHQSDRMSETAQVQSIDRKFVEDCISDISKIVFAMNKLSIEKSTA